MQGIVDSVAQQLIARIQRDPNDTEAYEALKAHYREGNDWPSLVNLLVGWANHTGSGRPAADALAEAGRLLAGLEQWGRAAESYCSALSEAEDCEAAVAGLVAIGDRYEAADMRIAFLREQLDALDRRSSGGLRQAKATLWQQLGRTAETLRGDMQAAAEAYEHALQLNPTSMDIAQDAERSAHARGDGERAQALRQMIDAATPEATANRYMAQAQQQAGPADRFGSAIATLREGLREVPGDIQIMYELAGLLLQRAECGSGAEASLDLRRAAELLYQIGQGLADVPVEALPYLEAALDAAPDHDGALSLLEQLAPVCDQSQQLPARWVAYLESAPPGPEVDQRRLDLGRAYARADQVDDAIFCLQQLPDNHPQAAALLSSLHGRTTSSESTQKADRPLGGRRSPRSISPSESRRADDLERVRALQKEVHRLVAAGDQDAAAERCLDIVAIDPADPEAFYFLESHYRRARAYAQLRDLLLSSTRTPGVPVDSRRSRLLEVAALSEQKLNDVDTAIVALQGVVTLSAADSDAARSLKRLLVEQNRWDEMVDVLEREALSTTAVDAKGAVLQELATIHRDRRGATDQSIEVLRQLFELQPDDGETWNQLRAQLREQGRYDDLTELLWARAGATEGGPARTSALHELLDLSQADAPDDALAYRAGQALRSIDPTDLPALAVCERIETARADHAALAETVESLASVSTGPDRVRRLIQLGEIALEHLGDSQRAEHAFLAASKVDPTALEALDGLCRVFEQSGRYRDLADLLERQSSEAQSDDAKLACQKRLARILDEHLLDPAGAAKTYQAVLEMQDDVTALRYLYARAVERDAPQNEADLLGRLANVTEDDESKRGLLFDLSVVQRDRLDDAAAAAKTLERLLTEVDGQFGPAVEALRELAESLGDHAALARALRCELEMGDWTASRAPLAQKLLQVAQELQDSELQLWALQAWSRCAPRDVEPHRQLSKVLDGERQAAELQNVLDALATLEREPEDRLAAALAGASLASDTRNAPKDAWAILQPWVEQGQAEAEQVMLHLCRTQEWLDQLVNLHVRTARNSEDPGQQTHHWWTAAQLLRNQANAPDKALEAAARALACDLQNERVQELVDELCVETRAWSRLAQIYDRLLSAAEGPQTRIDLLLRHAEVLEGGKAQPALTFSLLLQALQLGPDPAVERPLLDRIERLAAGHRDLHWLPALEQLIADGADSQQQGERLERAARYSEYQLADRTAAIGYLGRMVALSREVPGLADTAWALAQDFDDHDVDSSEPAAQRALVFAQRKVAEAAEPDLAGELLVHAAQQLRTHLSEPRAALALLQGALSHLATNDAVHDATAALAQELDRLPALERELTRLADQALDASETVYLLHRKAQLQQGPLGDASGAARTLGKLVQLRPRDSELFDAWRQGLRDAGLYQELLVAIARRLAHSGSNEETADLLREAAQTWEERLNNRFEALEAWRRLLAHCPNDPQAQQAIDRLAHRGRKAPSIDALLADDSPSPNAPVDVHIGAGPTAHSETGDTGPDRDRQGTPKDTTTTQPPPSSSCEPPALTIDGTEDLAAPSAKPKADCTASSETLEAGAEADECLGGASAPDTSIMHRSGHTADTTIEASEEIDEAMLVDDQHNQTGPASATTARSIPPPLPPSIAPRQRPDEPGLD